MTAEDEEWILQKLATNHMTFVPDDDAAARDDRQLDEPGEEFDRHALKRRAADNAAIARNQGSPRQQPLKPVAALFPDAFVRRPGTAGGSGLPALVKRTKAAPAATVKRELALPQIRTLKTFEVKTELALRGLDDTGARPLLLDRLEKAVLVELRAKAIGNTLPPSASTASLVSLPATDGAANGDASSGSPANRTSLFDDGGGGSGGRRGGCGGRKRSARTGSSSSSSSAAAASAATGVGETSSEPLHVTAEWLEVAVGDFCLNPRHARVPFGATVGWKVASTELGMIEYQLTVTDTTDENDHTDGQATRGPVAVSAPLTRNQLFKHQFTKLGLFQIVDDNYPEVFGTIEVYAVRGWQEKRKMILTKREEAEKRRREAEEQQATVERTRQQFERQEEERRWRAEADASAAQQQADEEQDPSLRQARERQRAEAIMASVDLATGGWRARVTESVMAREDKLYARQKEMDKAQAEREAARQAEEAARAAAEAEAARIRNEEAQRLAQEEFERNEQRLWWEKMQAEAEAEVEAEAEAEAEAETEVGARVTPAAAPAPGAATTPPGQSFVPTRPTTEPPPQRRPRPSPAVGVEEVKGSAANTPRSAADDASAVEGEGKGDPAGNSVVLEDGEALPGALEVVAGTAVTFTVSEDEPGMIEYGMAVRAADADVESEPLAASDALTSGESWEMVFSQLGVFVCTDPDYPEVQCTVTVVAAA